MLSFVLKILHAYYIYRKADVKMLKMSKVLNVEMDIDELRNDDFRYEILNKLFAKLFIVTILSSLNQALVLLMADFLF